MGDCLFRWDLLGLLLELPWLVDFVLQFVCDLWVMINVHGSRVIVDKNWTKERLGAGLPVGS